MTIEAGQKMPEATLLMRQPDKTNLKIRLSERLAGRKVALIGMPGAFTATCTGDHLPGLVQAAPDLRARGVDEIIVFAVNDPQVMLAWGEATGATEGGITLLADPMSELTEGLGLRFDNPDAGLIGRCIRFAAIVNDGTVETLKFEEAPLGCALTSGASLVDALGGAA